MGADVIECCRNRGQVNGACLPKLFSKIRRGLANYYHLDGLTGLLAVSANLLCGYPKELTVTHHGAVIRLRVRTTDIAIYRDVLLQREYAMELPFAPRVIVDAGANIGLASLYYAQTYPSAQIIAIEPEPSNFQLLRTNVAAYSNILPIHAALWKKDGMISVSEPDPSTGLFGKCGFVTHEGCGTPVRAITMPTLLQETGNKTIDLLKVDIEGAEKEVFESCDWIDCVKALVIELHERAKPGCRASLDAATGNFQKAEHGAMIRYMHL